MRLAPLALAAACFLTLFLGLDTVGYLDAREARDARVAEELRSSHELLTPLLGYRPLFDKPLLGYAPEVLTHDGATESPRRSRLLRAALATLLVLLTWRIGTRHFGERAGLLAGVVAASALALPIAARTDAAQLIATLVAWGSLATYAGIWFAPAGGDGPPRGAAVQARLLLAHAGLALVALVAGPMPALWPLAGVALYARLSREGGRRGALHAVAALVMVAGIAFPWYAAMGERHGLAFLERLAFFPYGANAPGPWYAGPVMAISLLVAAAFPWSALLPAAFTHAAMRWWSIRRAGRGGAPVDAAALARDEREERVSHFFIAGLAGSVAPLAFYPLPPISAALPALPAVALLCARFLDHLLEEPSRLRGVFTRACLMLAITGTVAAIAFSSAGQRLTVLFPGLRWVAPFVLLSGWAPLLAHAFLRRTALAASLMALPVLVGAPLVAWRLLPELEDFVSARRAAEAMNAVSPRLAALGLLEPPPSTLRLYTDRHLVQLDSLGELPRLAASDGYAYLAFRPSLEKETARRLRAPLEVLTRSPVLVLARVPAAP